MCLTIFTNLIEFHLGQLQKLHVQGSLSHDQLMLKANRLLFHINFITFTVPKQYILETLTPFDSDPKMIFLNNNLYISCTCRILNIH